MHFLWSNRVFIEHVSVAIDIESTLFVEVPTHRGKQENTGNESVEDVLRVAHESSEDCSDCDCGNKMINYLRSVCISLMMM